MEYKELIEQIKDYLSNCEQTRYGEMVGAPWPYNHDGPVVYTEPEAVLLDLASTSITDLLSRAEAAEFAQETLQRAMAEYKARAEKAEADLAYRHTGYCSFGIKTIFGYPIEEVRRLIEEDHAKRSTVRNADCDGGSTSQWPWLMGRFTREG